MPAKLTAEKFGSSVLLTEENERKLGWQGKTNDFTLIIEDEAIFFECKTSALFHSAKKHASLEEVRQDLNKNLASPKAKTGLFQLVEKIDAIKTRRLPQELNQKFERVTKFYPVILLYDQIRLANKPETLKNILDAELRAAGIGDFQYQVWHIEELENLYELLSIKDVMVAVRMKFGNDSDSSWDLNTLLYRETGKRYPYLLPAVFIPKGDTLALKTLQRLAKSETERPLANHTQE